MEPNEPGAFGCGSVSQFQYSWNQFTPVLLGVAPDGADDVREGEVDDRVAGPAVPDRQPVEADRALEERDPREQEHDDQRP